MMTTLITSVMDEQRNIRQPCDVRNTTWYENVKSLGLSALVLHDCLSPDQIVGLQTQHIRFMSIEPPTGISLGDYRFVLWYAILSGQGLPRQWTSVKVNTKWSPPVAKVFITDLFDVSFSGNPFELVFGSRYHVYLGTEEYSPPGWNEWMYKRAEACGRHDVSRHALNMTSYFFNTGLIGGPVQPVLSLLRLISLELLSSTENIRLANCDMILLNKFVHDLFSTDTVFAGYPLHSRFKEYEHASDAYIHHK